MPRTSRLFQMAPALLRRSVSVGMWATVCAVFSMLMGSGSIMLGAAMLCAVGLYIVVLIGPNFLASILLVGSPTFFGFPNQVLRPLPFVTLERLLLVVLAGMVFFRMAFAIDRRLNLSPLEKTICVFLGYAFISLLVHTSAVTINRDDWMFVQYAMPMSAFFISRRIAWRDESLRQLLLALSAAGVFLAASGLLQTFFGITVFTMNYQSVASGHVGRAFGTFSNAHTYTATLFIFLTTTLLQYTFCRDALLRFLLLAAIAVMLGGIVLGQSRGPWIGATLAMAIIFLRDPTIRPVLIVLGAIAAITGQAS